GMGKGASMSAPRKPVDDMRGAGATRPAMIGAIWAVVVLALDQASKLGLLFGADIASRPPIALTPFLDLTLVWNRGISYGMFQMPHDFGRWALVAGSVIAIVALGIWLMRAGNKVLAVGLGLIIGG